MNVFLDLGIKLPNAILVEGIIKPAYDELIDFVRPYGSINRIETISDADSEFNDALVVEFNNGSAVSALRPILPYTFLSTEHELKFYISELATIFTEHFSKTKTKSYLSELQNTAKLTGVEYKDMLAHMLAQVGLAVTELGPATKEEEEQTPHAEPTLLLPSAKDSLFTPLSPVPETFSVKPECKPHQPAPDPLLTSSKEKSNPNIEVQPSEVQRYIVEHIVKNEEVAVHHQRLRVFSGRIPRPSNESDYETWRSGVELLLGDPAVSDLQRSRRIVESLLPPAADMVKHLGPNTMPMVYLATLDSAYGAVQDGDELFAKFMDTYQDTGEKASAYLQRLQVALNAAIKRGGVKESDSSRHLLNQFCRGCWDDGLITELQLKQKKTQPPTFAELLLLLRTEEDREATKTLRMKQHLGVTRQKVTNHPQYVRTDNNDGGAVAKLTNITQQLAHQLADIQRQLAMLTHGQPKSASHPPATAHNRPPAKEKHHTNPLRHPMPFPQKPGFCFRCGEDGHIRPQCKNEPNSALVAHKKKLFGKKQYNSSTYNHLN